MSLLSVAKGAAAYLGIDVPDVVTSSTEREHVELFEFIAEAAEFIRDQRDWQALQVRATITSGDGATEAFDFPADFLRLPKAAQVWSTRLYAPLAEVDSTDRWNEIVTREYDYVSGVWIRFGDQIHIKPAPTATETVSYFYISGNIWRASAGGSARAQPDADSDEFRLNERVLKLGAIWRWKMSKELPWEADFNAFQDALARSIIDDKTSRQIVVGRRGRVRGARVAYPRNLS
ncbi:MAG: hypothetical protein AAFR28_03610 [Pseudomonadota bacterium]